MSSLHDVVKNRQRFPGEGCKLVFQKDMLASSARLDTRLVELSGIEPLTPCLQSRCSPS